MRDFGQFSIGNCYGCNAGVALETQRKRKQLLKIRENFTAIVQANLTAVTCTVKQSQQRVW